VLTHLDLDHAGAVPDFPHATVHVHARELVAAQSRHGRAARHRYVPPQLPGPDQVRTYDSAGDDWFGFTGVRALDDRNPDILLVPLHGHTSGHCGVAVRDGDRWLLHAGDSYFFHGQMDAKPTIPLGLGLFQRKADTDTAQRKANQAKVRELALGHADEVSVFCAHDPVDFDRFTTIP
jgi:glyoxylase-like metal-dependent hydrolase (beta-lactamase superfamily II)